MARTLESRIDTVLWDAAAGTQQPRFTDPALRSYRVARHIAERYVNAGWRVVIGKHYLEFAPSVAYLQRNELPEIVALVLGSWKYSLLSQEGWLSAEPAGGSYHRRCWRLTLVVTINYVELF
jgi:hypothetical protein